MECGVTKQRRKSGGAVRSVGKQVRKWSSLALDVTDKLSTGDQRASTGSGDSLASPHHNGPVDSSSSTLASTAADAGQAQVLLQPDQAVRQPEPGALGGGGGRRRQVLPDSGPAGARALPAGTGLGLRRGGQVQL